VDGDGGGERAIGEQASRVNVCRPRSAVLADRRREALERESVGQPVGRSDVRTGRVCLGRTEFVVGQVSHPRQRVVHAQNIGPHFVTVNTESVAKRAICWMNLYVKVLTNTSRENRSRRRPAGFGLGHGDGASGYHVRLVRGVQRY